MTSNSKYIKKVSGIKYKIKTNNIKKLKTWHLSFKQGMSISIDSLLLNSFWSIIKIYIL